MRPFDYTEKWEKLLTPEIVGYLTTIHEYKGEQRLIAERHADVLESLVEVAKIQSTESSNKIEGIYTSDDRLKKIVLDKTMPKTRNEREIAIGNFPEIENGGGSLEMEWDIKNPSPYDMLMQRQISFDEFYQMMLQKEGK